MTHETYPEKQVLAGNLVRLREGLGISQRELARRAGINRGYLLMMEDATANPSLEKLSKLAGVFGVSVVDLLT